MNLLILNLAPLAGLATALPAMTTAATRTVEQPDVSPKTDARRRRIEGERRGRDTPTHQRNGGYLLL